jgi:hypothetical protein
VKKNVGVLMASHDLNLAASGADICCCWTRGCRRRGEPEKVLDPELLTRVYGVPMERVTRVGKPPLVVAAGVTIGGARDDRERWVRFSKSRNRLHQVAWRCTRLHRVARRGGQIARNRRWWVRFSNSCVDVHRRLLALTGVHWRQLRGGRIDARECNRIDPNAPPWVRFCQIASLCNTTSPFAVRAERPRAARH